MKYGIFFGWAVLFSCPLLGWVLRDLMSAGEDSPHHLAGCMTGIGCGWCGELIVFFFLSLILAYLLLLYSAILCSQADSLHSRHIQFWMRDCSFLLRVFGYPSKWCTYSTILAGCGLYHLKDFYTDSVAFRLAEVFKLQQEWQQTEHGGVSCILGEYWAAWCWNYKQLMMFFVPEVVTVGSWRCFLSQEL